MNATTRKNTGLIILIFAIAIFVAATTVAALAGNQDEPETQPQTAEQDKKLESSSEYLRSLRAKEAELDRREKDLLQREQQIIVQEKELADKKVAFEKEKQDFDTMKATWEEEQQIKMQAAESERIRSIAASFKNIKSSTAAEQLTALFNENRTTALLIMNQLDTRTFGKIFDKISSPAKAAEMYEALKNWNISVDDARKIVSNNSEQ